MRDDERAGKTKRKAGPIMSGPKPTSAQNSAAVKLGKRGIALPASRRLRILVGSLLVLGGLLGFLPILGFWMLPLGALVLSYDLAWARRMRRRFTVWWHRRWSKAGKNCSGRDGNSSTQAG